MEKLLLFDIDGTLIRQGNKAHLTSITYAIKYVWGKKVGDVGSTDHSGKTDRKIMVELLHKERVTEKEIESKIGEAFKKMETFFKENVSLESIQPLKGVEELLEELQKRGNLMGLVTGNIEAIAKEKLHRNDLLKYFKVGGFGSDCENRADLIDIAIRRAEKEFGFIKSNGVVVFGDTPRDIDAGKKAGVTTVAVCTGKYSAKELEKESPDFIFENLMNKDEIIESILNDCL